MARSLYARLTRRHEAQPSRLERRQFLKLALAASAGLLVTPGEVLGRSGRGRRVIVIGAGFSGLACAHELIRAGCDVIVLEARNRIGGRVLSFRDMVAGKVVEGGGELIGSNHPTWMAYARRFGLRFNDVTEDESLSAPVILSGRRLSEKEAKALWEEMKVAYASMTNVARSINADEPWLSPNAAQIDAQSAARWIARLPVSRTCKQAIAVELSADNGVATFRQSFLGNLTQVKGGGLEKYWTESEVFRCRGGNAQLAHKLASAIGSERVRLNTPVREVRMHPERVEVRDASGVVHEGDDVVLAVPPSTWHHIGFNPWLPAALRPQMGVNVKYLAQVRSRFWKKHRLAPDSTTDGMVSMTWEATDNQGSDDENAVLTSFSGGPAAERARQRWALEKERAYADALSEIYQDFRQQFVRGRFMNWSNELWTGAGYSFPAPGQVTTVGPILRAGLGPLHFAGEHACYKFVGYMEGALNSGVAVAKRILNAPARADSADRRRARQE
jgi:monoamine oxidase